MLQLGNQGIDRHRGLALSTQALITFPASQLSSGRCKIRPHRRLERGDNFSRHASPIASNAARLNCHDYAGTAHFSRKPSSVVRIRSGDGKIVIHGKHSRCRYFQDGVSRSGIRETRPIQKRNLTPTAWRLRSQREHSNIVAPSNDIARRPFISFINHRKFGAVVFDQSCSPFTIAVQRKAFYRSQAPMLNTSARFYLHHDDQFPLPGTIRTR